MAKRESIFQAYLNRRMAGLLGIGFAAGMPSSYRFLGSSLQAWLLKYGYDLKTVGLFSLVGLPFAFNFVWAPFLDRYQPPILGRLGRRRGWILLFQLLIMAAMVLLALAGPTHEGAPLRSLVAASLLVAFLVASHDVVADAYRTDVLPDAELGAGAAVFVNGYRIGMLAAGGGALLLAEYTSWRDVYLMAPPFMLVGVIATLMAPNPPVEVKPATLRDAIIEPVHEYFTRTGSWAPALLALMVLFKLPDAMASPMITPLLVKELEFTYTQVAFVREGCGLAAILIGALIGGAMVARIGIFRSLWIMLVFQALSNLGFCYLAKAGPSITALFLVIGIENFCAGMVTAGFVAFVMSQCDRRYSATQYALFASLNYFTGLMGGAPTGFIVERIGYTAFFALTVAASLPAVVLLAILSKKGGPAKSV